MVSIYELKLGAEKPEILKALSAEIEKAIASIGKIDNSRLNAIYNDILEKANQVLQDKNLVQDLKDKVDVAHKDISEKAATISQKFEQQQALQQSLQKLKVEIETLLKSGLIDDTAEKTTTTYSSKKIGDLLKLKTDKANFDDLKNTVSGKLGKSETAADSAKLGGVAADKYAKKDNIPSDDLIREFSHTATTKELPDGDYGSSDFWKNIKPGIYYATKEKGSNKPENYGLVEVVSNGEISVTWSYGGNTYKWYKYFNNSTSAWRRLAILGENALPAGIIIVSARASTPDGFLLCDGSALSRTSYSTLFEAIGTAYGAGNGSSTFNIPDLRGEFIRGADSGRGVDAGRALGSAQGDAIRNITGWFNTWANDRKDSGGVFRIEKDIGTGDGNGTGDPVWKVVFEPERLVPVANENRPRNVAVNFYIKY